MTDYKKWQTTASTYIVNDRWLKLRADACITPDGHTKDPFYIFEYSDWISCLVLDENNDVIMIRQYRHGPKEYILEVIGGGVDSRDAGPEDAARREVKEELGYVGGDVVKVGVSYANPANQTNKVHYFLAYGGAITEQQALEPGENLHIIKMPFTEVVQLMQNSGEDEIFQSYNLTNLLFVLNYLRTTDNPQLQKLRY
jgi:8-oxo-dGTP pyrophosphatase MutT (NUDIX family)